MKVKGVVHSDCSSPDKKKAKTEENGTNGQNESRHSTDVNKLYQKRQKLIGRSTQVHFPEKPLYIGRGKGQYLYDENNNRYLDLQNNVAHVGHCHPKVVEAGRQQMEQLYTNSRYIHPNIVDLAQKLTGTLPDKLKVCFFTNSGTEANDLAIRLCQTYTKHKDAVVIDDAYHGHSVAVIDISPYKFKPLNCQPEHVHVVPRPDNYNGIFQSNENNEAMGEKYAQAAIEIMDKAVQKGRKIGMFIAESLLSCGGQTILPPGYLNKIYAHVRQLGGLCVADEVQVGFGRSGKAGYWAFQRQGVCPDIVTVGKPFGNGHPVSCVVTTEEVAQAFEDTKVAYFNTFGGNPVSMSIASAVMQVIEDEQLQNNAEEVGNHCMQLLKDLQLKHKIIGEVRGIGLFIGIVLVKNKETREPASDIAKIVTLRLRERFVLISLDGPHNNVLKVKPPMCITKDDVENFVRKFENVLEELNE